MQLLYQNKFMKQHTHFLFQFTTSEDVICLLLLLLLKTALVYLPFKKFVKTILCFLFSYTLVYKTKLLTHNFTDLACQYDMKLDVMDRCPTWG